MSNYLSHIAVIFTFSFGSAFGAISGYYKNIGTAHFNKAMEEVKKAGEIDLDGYTVDYKTVKNHEADILSAVLDYEKNGAATDYVGHGDAGTTIKQFLELKVTTGTGADAVETYLNKDLVMALVSEQYTADKEEAIAILNGLSLADYSTEKLDEVDADGCTTYVEHVQFLINEAIKGINKAEFDSDSTVAEYIEAKSGKTSPAADDEYIDKYFEAYKGEPKAATTEDPSAIVYTKLVKEKGYMAGSQPTGLGVYELNTAFVLKAATATEPAVTLSICYLPFNCKGS